MKIQEIGFKDQWEALKLDGTIGQDINLANNPVNNSDYSPYKMGIAETLASVPVDLTKATTQTVGKEVDNILDPVYSTIGNTYENIKSLKHPINNFVKNPKNLVKFPTKLAIDGTRVLKNALVRSPMVLLNQAYNVGIATPVNRLAKKVEKVPLLGNLASKVARYPTGTLGLVPAAGAGIAQLGDETLKKWSNSLNINKAA